MVAQQERPSSVFEKSIGNTVKVMIYPVEDDFLRVDIVYHLAYAKKRSRDLVEGDNYKCGDDPIPLLNWIRKRFANEYSLKLRDETMERIGEVVVEGCKYFGKPEPQTTS